MCQDCSKAIISCSSTPFPPTKKKKKLFTAEIIVILDLCYSGRHKAFDTASFYFSVVINYPC